MDYRDKYLKYKAKYLALKNQLNQTGGTKLKYYNVGKTEFDLKVHPVFKISHK